MYYIWKSTSPSVFHACMFHNQNILFGHDGDISCLTLSSKGSLIASGQQGGKNPDVIIWNFCTQREMYRFCQHEHGIQVHAWKNLHEI